MNRISLQNYSGLWYQIAAYPSWFYTESMYSVTAEYKLEGNTVVVKNTAYQLASDGSEIKIEANGIATPLSDDNRTLSVRFNELQPVVPNYTIEAIDPKYTYVVVSNPERDALYILYRAPIMSREDYTHITTNLASMGFDVVKLRPTPQLF